MVILTLDSGHSNSLAVITALKPGHKIITSGSERFSICRFSRYADFFTYYADPVLYPNLFIKSIIDLIKTHQPEVIIPVGINTTIPISYYKNQLNELTKVPVSDYNTLKKLHDKESCIRLANKYGLRVPKTYKPKNLKDLKKISDNLSYPVVIKVRKGSSSEGLRYAVNPNDLKIKYCDKRYYSRNDIAIDSTYPLVQEYIKGNTICDVCVLLNEGTPIAGLTQERILMYPNSGGGGVFNITTYEPDLLERTFHFLEKINYHGVAQVEYKKNDDGEYVLIEVNTKFWGTLDLSIKAGMNFPRMLVSLSRDGNCIIPTSYKVGLKYLFVKPALGRHLIYSKNKYKKIKYILNHHKSNLSLYDPVPSFLSLLATFYEYYAYNSRRYL
jgi:predicted ATP-grasp superfamily ATP-dependent carboligase